MFDDPVIPQGLFNVRFARSLDVVDAEAWDACANPGRLGDLENVEERYNPFVSHAFLRALEVSRSVGGETGWTPAHVLVEGGGGRLVGATPSYVKSHSLGEYVFDQGWARAYSQAGGRYYPKIQVAAPFTPAPGRRLLIAGDAPRGVRDALIAGLRALARANGASSIHVTFATAEDARALAAEGFLLRTGEQFHFRNVGYRDFDEFLSALSSRKRKMIKRERKEALGADLEIDLLTGTDIKRPHWDAFFTFYLDTGSRKWGRPYLTREFFEEIGRSMSDRVLLIMARHGARYVAGAINFLGDDAIYGRNWGAIEDRPFLHFEVCYYQAIEYAIRHGYRRVEAGAQGEHKLARGYRPVITHSAHEFSNSRLGAAVAQYLEREHAAVNNMIGQYETFLPFRRE